MKNNCGTMTEQNTMYFHPDHLGSSSYVTDKKGNFFEMIEYLPYGETLYDEAATVDKTEFRFTGHLKDDETGFYYCHARYYDAKIGRFISTDPILEMYLQGKPNDGVYRSINNDLYRYAANNPIMYNDPDGMADKVERKYNGSFLEEKPIKPIRPSTGILPVYDEKKPNEFGDRGKIQGSTNCTAYALNYIRNPVTKKEFGNSESLNNFGWQPGMLAEKRLPPSFDYVGNILADAKKVGISMVEVEKNAIPSKNQWKVALFIDSGNKKDYHWYRQDINTGTWSNKMGGGKPSNRDSYGNLIYDPSLIETRRNEVHYFIIGASK